MAELGGRHLHEHHATHDLPAGIHRTDQRSASSNDADANDTGHAGGQATAEETSNDDDDEDSSAAQDEQEDDEEEPDTIAPSHGRGKGKGKGMRPAIRIEPVGEDESQAEEEPALPETGLSVSHNLASSLLAGNKKRTYSNVSNTSVLFGDDESDHTFPRRKIARKLSNSSFKPLLKYKENANEDMNDIENAIESDDEDYSGVNLVPEDESEIEYIEEQEESFIIQDEMHSTSALISQFNDARRLSLDSLASDNIFDFAGSLDQTYDVNHADMGFARFFEPAPIPASPEVAAKRKFSDSSTKRVRFDDEVQMSDSSSSSSDELDSSLYPDLFLDQDKLPASLSQLLEYDHDEDYGDYDSPASEMSFWDFGQDELQQSHPGAEEFEESSDPGSSGYETDMGDTTDEYESDSDAPPETPLRRKSVLRQPSSAPGSRFNSPQAFERSFRPTGRAIPPTRGIFIHEDFSKAIAVTNRTTKRLTFYRPRTPLVAWVPLNGAQSSSTSNANDSPRTSLAQLNASDSEVSNEVFSNPFTTSDIMLTGIFGSAPSNDYFFGTDSIGPPEAFYPFVSIGTNGAVMDDEDDAEDEDYEDDLNITDFMDFGSDVDATDVEQEDDETDMPATPAASTMAMPGSTPAHSTPMADSPVNRKRTTSDAMLQHFDRGVVTAFRNNQNRYRDIAQLPSDPTIRASVSRPVRSGKSAETLMTPLRKRPSAKRTAKSPFQASSPMVNASSPLSGVTKASSRLNKSLMNPPPRAPRMGAFT
ncbi:uncharacterized protein N0V89_009144 [Didymosphaeria variabile]|uniref:Uncharacterized protein n=1 Tax=Didymosphaeria variabile TaxID=1932322 RepID=A0A9W8XHK8_9PLEO|nr:uncharacterized protein N0V89_009144 [Didymosphaeria variabile]KAJ4350523.1 hypothetical protein N0V89_009144 [Didymosphaeria variabile]